MLDYQEIRIRNVGYLRALRNAVHEEGYSLHDLAERGVRLGVGRFDGYTPAYTIEADALPHGWCYDECAILEPRRFVARALKLAGLR